MQTAHLSSRSKAIDQGFILDGLPWPDPEAQFFGVVLSNTCDFEQDKLAFLTVAAAMDARLIFQSSKEFREITKGTELSQLATRKRESLSKYAEKLIFNKDIGRYFSIDARPLNEGLLVVDFQNLLTLPYTKESQAGTAIGRVQAPYCQKMIAHFAAYTARVGVDRQEDFDNILELLCQKISDE